MDEEKKEPRSIDELADLPYSEMSEEEIGIMVEFRAECKARDTAHIEQMAALQAHLDESAQRQKEMADSIKANLNDLTAHAIRRFEEMS